MASTKCKRIFSHVTNAIDSTAVRVHCSVSLKVVDEPNCVKIQSSICARILFIRLTIVFFLLVFRWVDGRLDLCRPEYI